MDYDLAYTYDAILRSPDSALQSSNSTVDGVWADPVHD